MESNDGWGKGRSIPNQNRYYRTFPTSLTEQIQDYANEILFVRCHVAGGKYPAEIVE